VAEHPGDITKVVENPIFRHIEHVGQLLHRETVAFDDLDNAQIYETWINTYRHCW